MHYKNTAKLIIFIFFFSLKCLGNNFASIKSKTNLRAGPGKQYPINWTLTLPSMPIKIIEENLTYSKVELHDGTVGWIWNATISKKRTFIVIKESYIYNKENENIAFIKKNVILQNLECDYVINEKKSCKVKINSLKGYINEKSLWGIINTN